MKFTNQVLKGSLIEEWGTPTVYSRSTTLASSMRDGRQVSTMKSEKRVTISEFSCQRIYTFDPFYEASKCYTSSDRKRFKEEAIRDGFRIRRLISSYPLPTGRAVQELLMNGVLTREDLLGIDHLCSLRLAEKVLNERRSHMKLVLSAQEELKRANGLVDSEKLAVIAVKGSVGNVAKARQRAVLALH
jgi:hypothetical protein